MAEILDLIKRLYPFPCSVTGKGNDSSLPLWLAELPFEVSEYPSGAEYNGWTIPPRHGHIQEEFARYNPNLDAGGQLRSEVEQCVRLSPGG